jgi:hypothetical protein
MATRSRRTRRLLIFACVQLIFAALIVCAFFYRALIDSLPFGNIYSNCPFHDFVHLYCPGCGGTRAMIALFRGQLVHSLLCNPLSAYLAVGFFCFDGVVLRRILRDEPRVMRLPIWYFWVLLAIAVVNFVLRNVLLVYFGIDYLGDLISFWHP